MPRRGEKKWRLVAFCHHQSVASGETSVLGGTARALFTRRYSRGFNHACLLIRRFTQARVSTWRETWALPLHHRYGLDLSDGFNALRQNVYRAVGSLADLMLSLPPYGDMSRLSQDDFLEALETLLSS
jgi:hypothetical protein